MSDTNWVRVSRREPCPICQHADWCTIREDRKVACCMREASSKQAHNGGYFHDLDQPALKKAETHGRESRGPGITLEGLALDRQMDSEKLKDAGWDNFTYQGKPAVLIPYKEETGNIVRNRLRLNLNKEDGERFLWGKGDRIIPYGLQNLKWIQEEGYCVLVEGEVDTEVLLQSGFPALGIPGAQAWKSEWRKYLPDGIIVFIWQENDEAAKSFIERVARDFHCNGKNNELWGTALVIKSPPEAKDAARLKKLHGGQFSFIIKSLLDSARYAIPVFSQKAGFEML